MKNADSYITSFHKKVGTWVLFGAACVAIVLLIANSELWDVVVRNRKLLMLGAINTWLFAIGSIVVGTFGGIVLGGIRFYAPPLLRMPVAAIVEILRATPQLVVILWIFFVVPELTNYLMSPELSGFIALTIIAAVYLSEVIRSGLNSVPIIQNETAFTTGLTSFQSFYHIVLPQALRNMIPALVATFVLIFKMTTLLHVLGIGEFFHYAYIVNSIELIPYTIYLIIALFYFIFCSLISFVVRKLDPNYVIRN